MSRKVTTTTNHAIPLAHMARKALEPHGWTCKGSAWIENASEGTMCAEVTAARGEELISIRWTVFADGKINTEQSYSLWDVDKPSRNMVGKPPSDLPFNVDEISDRELAQELAGRQLTWWNRTGSNQETGKVPDKLKINHVYSGTGDEVPEDRIITFVDVDGMGFRSFRLGALLKAK